MPTLFARLPDDVTFQFGVPLITSAFRLLRRSIRFNVVNRQIEDQFITPRKPCLMALWHQTCLFQAIYYQGKRIVIMVSQSREGEMISRALKDMGHIVVRGSSTRGGLEAMHEQIRYTREGNLSAVICDGPRGPARVLKIGIILMARESGLPILPIGFATRRCIKTRSWDATLIPLPHSRVVIHYGEPIFVPADIRKEECFTYRQKVEEALNGVTCSAEEEL